MSTVKRASPNTTFESILRLESKPKLIIDKYNDTDECLCFTEDDCAVKNQNSNDADDAGDSAVVSCCKTLVWTGSLGRKTTFTLGTQAIDGYPVYENASENLYLWWQYHGDVGHWSVNE